MAHREIYFAERVNAHLYFLQFVGVQWSYSTHTNGNGLTPPRKKKASEFLYKKSVDVLFNNFCKNRILCILMKESNTLSSYGLKSITTALL